MLKGGDINAATVLFRRILKLARNADQIIDLDPSTDAIEDDPKAVAKAIADDSDRE